MHMHHNHHHHHLNEYELSTISCKCACHHATKISHAHAEQSYHNHHPIATMHASVHTSTTHAMCISRICACLFSHNVPHCPPMGHMELLMCQNENGKKEQIAQWHFNQQDCRHALPCNLQLIYPSASLFHPLYACPLHH